MRPQRTQIVLWFIAMMLILYLLSCGTAGQESLIRRYQDNPMNAESTTTTMPEQPQAPSKKDSPQYPQMDMSNFHMPDLPDPVFSNLPHYCDPRNYPPNIVDNARACFRFQPIPYLGFGLDDEPITPIIENIALRRRLDDDDDEYGRRWRYLDRPLEFVPNE